MKRNIGLIFFVLFAASTALANPIPMDDDYEYPDYDYDLIENIFVRGDGSTCVVIFIAESDSEVKYQLERIDDDEKKIIFENLPLYSFDSVDGFRHVIPDVCVPEGGHTYVLSIRSGVNNIELYRKFVYVDRTQADCFDTSEVCDGVVSAGQKSDDDDDDGCGCTTSGNEIDPLLVSLLFLSAVTFSLFSLRKGRK